MERRMMSRGTSPQKKLSSEQFQREKWVNFTNILWAAFEPVELHFYCKLVRDLDACLCLQLLPFISVLFGDATNGMASLLQLIY